MRNFSRAYSFADIGKMDWAVFVVTMILFSFGIVLVYSSSFALAQQRFGGDDFFLLRQVSRGAIGLLCFIIFANIDYRIYRKLSPFMFAAAIAVLVYVLLLPDSMAINGAKRWLILGPVRVQVSEFARLALICMVATHLSEKDIQVDSKTYYQLLVKIGIICFLVFLEPDFSTAVILAATGLTLLFVGGARIKNVLTTIVFAVPLILFAVLKTPYRRQRLMGFLKPSEFAESLGYQSQQALIGLGNGGIAGVGLGKGEQKFFYLPEPHTDFVFSILGEEIGFVGICIVLSLFAILVYRGFRIAFRAPDTFGRLLAFGITAVISFYVLLHGAVNTAIVPTTGVPLPFISYGGMSLVFTMISMGILLNISARSGTTSAPGGVRWN